MSQVSKRKSTPNTRAGQYMCAECGKIVDTKKEVENHQRLKHDPHRVTAHGKVHQK